MRVLYLDCFSGISGDMTVGALVDAGASAERIEQELKKLPVFGYEIEWRTVVRKGISATKFDVHLVAESHSHDHTHHQDDHDHLHEHTHAHHHEHGGGHHHGDGHHEHRHYREIIRMIDVSDLPEGVKVRSKQIFAPIAESEAAIHGIPVEDVHFHEVGAVDSIVDIVAVAIALEELGVEAVYASAVPLGSGHIHCAHGIYPVPAPATLDMLRGVPLMQSTLPYELTTPTGAGIIAGQVQSFGPLPSMTVTAIGYGAGTKDIPDRPNVLRVIIGELSDSSRRHGEIETISVLECQMDDMNGEHFGYVLPKLLDAGALDVFYTPVYMKKSRPGVLVTVLAAPQNAAACEEILLLETTTLGVRKSLWERRMLQRQIVDMETPFGTVKVKQAIKAGKVIRQVPEYEDVRRIAETTGVPFYDVYNAAVASTKLSEK